MKLLYVVAYVLTGLARYFLMHGDEANNKYANLYLSRYGIGILIAILLMYALRDIKGSNAKSHTYIYIVVSAVLLYMCLFVD